MDGKINHYRNCLQYIEPTDIVVDVGCGQGDGTLLLSSVAKKVIGIDKNKEKIIYAMKKNKRQNNYYIHNNLDQMEAFPLCDVVVAIGLVDKLRFPQSFISKVQQSVRKKIIIMTVTVDGTFQTINHNEILTVFNKNG